MGAGSGQQAAGAMLHPHGSLSCGGRAASQALTAATLQLALTSQVLGLCTRRGTLPAPVLPCTAKLRPLNATSMSAAP